MQIRYLLFICFLFLACKGELDLSTDNIVNIRLEEEPDRLNPVLSTTTYSKQVEAQLFMPMLQYRLDATDLYPVLAISRPEIKTINKGKYKGGRSYSFKLRPEAQWDDGKPVLAKDFIFTLKTFMHPEIDRSGFGAFLSFIKKIEIDSTQPKNFTVYTDQSINITEEMIGTMAIYPSHLYDPKRVLENYDFELFSNREKMLDFLEKDKRLSEFASSFKSSGQINTIKKVKGCGPYKIQEWIQGERMVLKKKENWWASRLKIKSPAFAQEPEQLVYHFIEEDATLTALFKEQKIDVSGDIDPIVFENYKENELMQSYFNFYTPLSSSYFFIGINMNDPKLKDRASRQAISHLTDVDELIKIVMNGYGEKIAGPILPSKPYYKKNLKPYEFDILKAKDLLKSAGWEDQNGDGVLEKELDGTIVDFSITFKYTSNFPLGEKVGVLLKNNAIKAGINIDLVPLERNKLIEDTRSRSFDLYFSRWSQKPGLDDLRSIWHTASDTPRGFNKTGFGNAHTDNLIDSINTILNEEKRMKKYYEIQDIIYKEQPYVFLFVPTERIAIHKRFEAEAVALRPGYLESMFKIIK